MGKLTYLLLLANILIFLLVFSMPEPMRVGIFQALSFSSEHTLEIWRWFTSLFLHMSASHLFFNMVGLYFFGKIVEDEVDSKWYMAIYLAAGLLGTLAFSFTSAEPVVGASGAVFGLLGASMLLDPVRRIHMYVFPLPLGIIALTFLFLETMVVYFQPGSQYGNVAHVAHLAGIMTGAVFGFFNNPKQAVKGIIVLGICVLLLMFLAPVFSLITSIGGLVLLILEKVIGFFLYNIAGSLGFLWG